MCAKNATTKQWAALFEAAQSLKDLQPWLYMASDDLLALKLQKTPVEAFCSVMGFAGDCYGVSVFVGEAGLRDFYRLRDIDRNLQSPLYVMRDQTCLTLYWGDRDEVPPEQKVAMKALGLRFRGSGNWPYVVSFERRYGPETPDARNVEILTESLQHIEMIARAFAGGQLSPEWDGRVMLMRTFCADDGLWHTAWADMPELPGAYPEIRLTDDLLKARLKSRPRTQTDMLIDLIYLDGIIKGGNGGRDFTPLGCIAADVTTGTVLGFELLAPEDRETDAVLDAFTNYIMAYGKMRSIRARNPWVLAALKDICAYCGIPLARGALPEMDEIAEELSHALATD